MMSPCCFAIHCHRRFMALAAMTGLAFMIVPAAAAADETLTVHSEDWEDYTEKDGSGFAWDVVRAVYEPAGVKIEIGTMPYARAVMNVTNGQADAWVGSYDKEVEGAVYPDWHYDADEVEALIRKEDAATWSGNESLRSAAVAWIRGYKIGTYLDVPVAATRLSNRDSAVLMLERGRIEAFLDARFELDLLLEELPDGLTASDFTRRPVTNLPLFLGFAPNERGRNFAAIWDQRFPKLLKSGKIAEIYNKHGMTFWPFNEPRPEATDAVEAGTS